MSSKTIEIEAELIRKTMDRRNLILLSGRTKADDIVKVAEEQAGRIKEDMEQRITDVVNSRIRALKERNIGEARLEGMRRLMAAREETMSSVFAKAEAKLKEMAKEGSEEYAALLKRLMMEAVERIGGASFIVSANERDLERIKRLLTEMEKETSRGSINPSDRPIECMGGVVVESGDGTKIYNNTLDGRLLRARRLLRAEIAKAMEMI